MNTISVPGNLYSVSPLEYHAKSRSPPSPSGDPGPSLDPALKPSSDIESPVVTFPMFALLSLTHPVTVAFNGIPRSRAEASAYGWSGDGDPHCPTIHKRRGRNTAGPDSREHTL